MDWPPPEKIDLIGFPFERRSMSDITHEERKGMTNVASAPKRFRPYVTIGLETPEKCPQAHRAADRLQRRCSRRREGGDAGARAGLRQALAVCDATRADTVGTLTTGGYLEPTYNFQTAGQALLSMLVLVE